MRFRQLELIRYGGFADRLFDFGEGSPDLHLIVGPNEAGKSTALQAIGDFLFGIPGQSRQNWRFEYNQLRLRGVVEHNDEIVEITRRKGNRDTLLQADGTPFAADPLAAMLGRIDRAAFERMFGLDHAKLREGGESILSGRDDAARITLEAGTGIRHIGDELTRLTEAAGSLFKPGGQNPIVNRLLRERAEALAQVRQMSITDAQWTQSRQRRADAEARRAALIDEAEKLDREHARLDRLGRARAPCVRLANAREKLDTLGQLPDLPIDAEERLTQARSERRVAVELREQILADLARTDQAIAGLNVPEGLLAARERIEALDERRAVIAKASFDLGRLRAELDRVDARIDLARREAGLSSTASLPTSGWRKRAATHLEAQRELKALEAHTSKERAKLTRDLNKLEGELALLGDGTGLPALTAALAMLPVDGEERLEAARAEVARKQTLLDQRMAELAPWRGSVVQLRELIIPSQAEAAKMRSAAEASLAEVKVARNDAQGAQERAIQAEARLALLSAGGEIPTFAAITSARAHRDACVEQVRHGLTIAPTADALELGQALAHAIFKADHLADRRDSEATRVAEHSMLLGTIQEAQGTRAAALDREARCSQELKELEARWESCLKELGFVRQVAPEEFPIWIAKRLEAIQADDELSKAERVRDELVSRFGRARAQICTAYGACYDTGAHKDDPDLVAHATAAAAQMETDIAARANLAAQRQVVRENLAELAEHEGEQAQHRAQLRAELARLVSEAGLGSDVDDIALADALEAFNQVIEELGARDGLFRQVQAMESDRAAFEMELSHIAGLLAQERATDSLQQVRELAVALRGAVRDAQTLAEQTAARVRLATDLDSVDARIASAQASITELMQAAGAEDEPTLDRLVSEVSSQRTWRSAEREALDELAGADNGAGLDNLVAELASLPFEEEAAARARIDDRRREVAAERELVGGQLNAAEEEVARAASESAAADAQQAATETTAALAQAAEEHIQAATAAALLRWMLDRHRATNQAPLIARAGNLFRQVTRNAFSGLAIGYANDDRPVILAIRTDGSEVGVEALSEGTRDQLYLALRLGSIEGRAGAGALPIVCDDLLITADDERSAALLQVLAAASAHSQVIVFSHHAHLIDVAKQAIGPAAFKLHTIDRASSLAA